MENTINFGIDLGTTNSAIAKFIKGEVEVYKSPTDWKETISSVVGFKKDKILVGQKAKELLEKRPQDVFGVFKRKMGTSESFKIKALDKSITPIELSAFVLKELKTFVPKGENIEAAVITIPASFDTIQSNATKEAGVQAGFKQVVLLQEPIAASLAYANKKKEQDLSDGQWLVYDLGGGTFDVALMKVQNGEMKVIDHEGDNFLGGADFDRLIIERLVVPKLEEKYSFTNLKEEFQSASGKYNNKYYVLLHNAEQAKIMLSSKTSAEIEILMEDDEGNEIDEEITVTRSEFSGLIKELVNSTTEMIKKILVRNSLKPTDIQFTLMIGGSTYIPYVRQRVEEVLQIPINCEVDPTTAVAVGAAYFAGTKTKTIRETESNTSTAKLQVKMAYQKVSKEIEELFSARVIGDVSGIYYRITRDDGGYNTGLKKLTERINEDLPLVEDAYNFFTFVVYDEQNNVIETNAEPIGIAQGKYGIAGQPLPADICLQVDDIQNEGETKLDLVFQKNSILPLRKTIPYPLNKTLIQGSSEEVVRVNVVEGPHTSIPEANKSIGYLEITGKNITRNVHKGSDIEITLEMSESRDLVISVYLNMADQEFKQTFNPKARHTPVDWLQEQVAEIKNQIESELVEATQREDYETANTLNKLKKEMEEVSNNANNLTEDDVTDKRYQIEDRKQKIAQKIDNATKDKRVQVAKAEYFELKEQCLKVIEYDGNDHDRKLFRDVVNQENAFLSSNSPLKIQEKIDELDRIYWNIRWRTPSFLVEMFRQLVEDSYRMNDQEQVRSLIEAGKFAIESQNWERLGEIVSGLFNQLPKSAQKEVQTKIGFGS